MSLIAIVDDEPSALSSIEKHLQLVIKKFFPNRGIKVAKFQSGMDLILYFSRLKPELVILDYQMPEMNGFETAVKIHELNHDVQIIFLTNFEQHWKKGYQVNAFDYIIKSDESRIYISFHNAIKNILDKNIDIYFQTRNGIISLTLDQLTYAESYGRNMCIHLINHEQSIAYVNGGITAFYQKVKNHNFISPRVSYCVNLKYIVAVDEDNNGLFLTVTNGANIGISRNKQKDVIKRIGDYMERKPL